MDKIHVYGVSLPYPCSMWASQLGGPKPNLDSFSSQPNVAKNCVE